MAIIKKEINDKFIDLAIDNFIEYYRFYHPEFRIYIRSCGSYKLKKDICETIINHDINDKIDYLWKCIYFMSDKSYKKKIEKTLKNYFACVHMENLTYQIKYLIKIVIINNMLIEGFL